jgi:hypothetical protein
MAAALSWNPVACLRRAPQTTRSDSRIGVDSHRSPPAG